jgi:parallel beta-helix repeat protein
MTVTDCVIMDSSADKGGGVFCSSSSSTFIGCTIEKNTSKNGGGVYLTDRSNPTFVGSVIRDNFASTSGGGLDSWGCHLLRFSIVALKGIPPRPAAVSCAAAIPPW